MSLEAAPAGEIDVARDAIVVVRGDDASGDGLHDVGRGQIELPLWATEEEVGAALAGDELLAEATTLVDLRLRGYDFEDAEAGVAGRDAALAVFRLARALSGSRRGAALRRIVLATDLGGELGFGQGREQPPTAALAAYGAAAGAWKSVVREWAQDGRRVELRIVDLPPAQSHHAWRALAAEVVRAGPLEVACTADGRRAPVLRAADVAPAPIALDSESVFLITGGARGVVAEIAAELARRYRCRIVLVGRSARGTGRTPLDAAGARRMARAELGDEAPTPAVNERAEVLRRQSEVAATIARLEELGAQILYVQGDVSDPEVAMRAATLAEERFGGVDVVIHGAGVDKSRALSAKNEEEITSVLAPKLAAADLYATAEGARRVAIASVSGRFGNAGQIDYCAANEALAKLTLRDGGLVLDFTAWADVGMAAPIARGLRERGVDPLATATAAGVAVDLIAGGATGEWVLSGRLPLAIEDDTFADNAELTVAGSEIWTSATLSLDTTPYLADHRPTSAGVLPAVVALQAMIDAAAHLEPTLPLREVRDFVIDAALKAFPGHTVTAGARAHRLEVDRDALVCSASLVSGVSGDVEHVVHHKATLRFGGAAERAVVTPHARLEPGPGRAEVYKTFFHGPSFQVLDRCDIGDGVLRAVSVPLEGELGRGLPERVRPTVMARELVLQACGVYLMHRERRLALPIGIEHAVITGAPRRGERVLAVVTFRGTGDDPNVFAFDAQLRGEDERVLEDLRGVSFRRLADMPGAGR